MDENSEAVSDHDTVDHPLKPLHHVSCEDLLDFALDKPCPSRTRGPPHGVQSDEVKLLLKLTQNQVWLAILNVISSFCEG